MGAEVERHGDQGFDSTLVSVTDIKEKLFGNQETKTSSYYFKNVTHMTAI